MQRDPTMHRRKKPDVVCRRHPKHPQPPGVCSICLREKLAQLSSGSSTSSTSFKCGAGTGAEETSDSSSSSLSPYESSSSSASSTQMSPLRPHKSVKGSGMFGKRSNNDNDALTKSRWITFMARKRRGGKGEGVENRDNKHKIGFWSRLIPGGGRKKGGLRRGLKHSSKTVRDQQ